MVGPYKRNISSQVKKSTALGDRRGVSVSNLLRTYALESRCLCEREHRTQSPRIERESNDIEYEHSVRTRPHLM